jgi:excisionase family DNA binding protein
MSNSELLSIPEAAQLLRLQPSTIRSWVLKRKLPYLKLGRLVRLRRADIEALINRSVVPAADREAHP